MSKRVKPINVKMLKKYMIPIFSTKYNTWFHDIFDNGKGGNPRYFHIFIGTNNRYAVVYPLKSRDKKNVIDVLKKFILDYKPVKLTSDCETSFRSNEALTLLKNNNVNVRFVSDGNHSILSIIDRFIRTIRDSKNFNGHFTLNEMNNFVDSYNHKVHSSTGFTPFEMMFNDENHEKENSYIDKMCMKLNNPDPSLKPGDYVKVRKQYGNLEKKRGQYTYHSFILGRLRGGMYEVKALDDTYIMVPRWRLIKLKPSNKDPVAASITDFKKDGILGEKVNERKGKPKVIPGKIVGYNDKNKRYIIGDKDGKSDYTYEISVKNYRGDYPLTPTLDEQRFIKMNNLGFILDQ